ncbi:DNA-packaging protein [Salmonella enterica subsp. enterica serovar Typhimurium]|nr:DNA-packaging protein [Salmonella enterica subsp. enterica serovar Typhimurium]
MKDNEQDDLLQDLIDDAQSHFKLITGSDKINDKYQFIIRDVVAKRYNRKVSEGMASENVDGYSVNYHEGKSDFDEYMSLLERDFDLNDDSQRKKGKVYVY